MSLHGSCSNKVTILKDLDDRTAIISGPGSGLGRSLTLLLHATGARLALCDTNFADDEREAAHLNFSKYATLDADKTAVKILRAIPKTKGQLVLGVDTHVVYSNRKLFPGRFPKILGAIFSQVKLKPEESNP